MRIDLFLLKNGYTDSRTEAKSFILEGSVKVNGKTVLKPSFEVSEECEIEIDKSSKRFVSRGGFKLEGALDAFKIDVNGKDAIDIGASTGGFTDCLLQRGARRVIALDTGVSQLSPKLLNDERVISYENYNARYLKSEDFSYSPNFAVMDVSFISATYIIKPLFNLLEEGADFICLIKPQFEVGPEFVGKGGIVKSEKARLSAIDKVVKFSKNAGFAYVSHITSSIVGGDGNIEYLAYFKK